MGLSFGPHVENLRTFRRFQDDFPILSTELPPSKFKGRLYVPWNIDHKNKLWIDTNFFSHSWFKCAYNCWNNLFRNKNWNCICRKTRAQLSWLSQSCWNKFYLLFSMKLKALNWNIACSIWIHLKRKWKELRTNGFLLRYYYLPAISLRNVWRFDVWKSLESVLVKLIYGIREKFIR